MFFTFLGVVNVLFVNILGYKYTFWRGTLDGTMDSKDHSTGEAFSSCNLDIMQLSSFSFVFSGY